LLGTSVLHNTLWRQGSVLPRQLMSPESLPEGLEPEAKIVVLTHSCDVVQRSFELEPYVELLIARRVATIDGSKTKGKNPRRIQFPIEVNGVEEYYEICIHDKIRLDRKLLEGGSPDASCRISAGDIRRMGSWAGKRYHREAFPTEFNSRITQTAKKKFKKALQKHGAEIRGIFIALFPDTELAVGENYQVIVRLVAEREVMEDYRSEDTLLGLVGEMYEAFALCSGIEVIDLQIVSEAEFTLDDWRKTKVWDYDELSDADAPDYTPLAN
jgi:hypothetical protein